MKVNYQERIEDTVTELKIIIGVKMKLELA
jgi:hypothetical protein